MECCVARRISGHLRIGFVPSYRSSLQGRGRALDRCRRVFFNGPEPMCAVEKNRSTPPPHDRGAEQPTLLLPNRGLRSRELRHRQAHPRSPTCHLDVAKAPHHQPNRELPHTSCTCVTVRSGPIRSHESTGAWGHVLIEKLGSAPRAIGSVPRTSGSRSGVALSTPTGGFSRRYCTTPPRTQIFVADRAGRPTIRDEPHGITMMQRRRPDRGL